MRSRKILALVIVVIIVISIPLAIVIQNKKNEKQRSSAAGVICPPGVAPGTIIGGEDCEPGNDVPPPPPPITATPVPTAIPEIKPADVDRNGCVGIVDFNAWFQAFKTGVARSGTAPDINKDGSVSIVDFNLWFKAMLSLPKKDLC